MEDFWEFSSLRQKITPDAAAMSVSIDFFCGRIGSLAQVRWKQCNCYWSLQLQFQLAMKKLNYSHYCCCGSIACFLSRVAKWLIREQANKTYIHKLANNPLIKPYKKKTSLCPSLCNCDHINSSAITRYNNIFCFVC